LDQFKFTLEKYILKNLTMENLTMENLTMEKSTMKPKMGSKQRGYTIVELLIVVAIFAAAMIAIINSSTDATGSISQTAASAEIVKLQGAVKTWRSSKARQNSTTTLSVAKMIADGTKLGNYTTGVGENAYGKDVSLTASSGGVDWTMVYTTATAGDCIFHKDSWANSDALGTPASCAANVLTLVFD
jgi:prepilin-type N-terminal cleavage/methylation domain-containing protein